MYVGCKVSFKYNGTLRLGYVKSERMVGDRMLMVVERDGVCKSYYRDQMEDFNFFEPSKRQRREYVGTGEPCDAARDRYNERYGYGAWKSRRYR